MESSPRDECARVDRKIWLAELQKMVRRYDRGSGSAVDQLLAERRAEEGKD